MRPLILALALAASPAAAEDLTLLSFNIYGGGANDDKPVDETVAVLKAVDADIAGIQETRLESEDCEADYCPADGPSVAPALAEAMSYQVYEQTAENEALWANAVMSRFPITGQSPNDLGVGIDVNGREVWIFNVHLDDEPYGPYQVVGIEYGPAPFVDNAADAIMWAQDTRGGAMELLMSDIEAVAAEADLVIVTGDFNEPSGRDWTEEVAALGTHPIGVDWPTTRILEDAGFVDAYRAVHPDPVEKPAFTWTPMWSTEDDPEDHHDRIDFIFVRGEGVEVLSAEIVGETGERTDLAVDPWPSDHRAVRATVSF